MNDIKGMSITPVPFRGCTPAMMPPNLTAPSFMAQRPFCHEAKFSCVVLGLWTRAVARPDPGRLKISVQLKDCSSTSSITLPVNRLVAKKAYSPKTAMSTPVQVFDLTGGEH